MLLLSLTLGDRPAWVVALTEQTAADPITLLINYGPLGIFLALLVGGQFRTKYEVQRLEREVDRLHTDIRAKDELIRAFQMQLTGHTLPALAQSARVFEAIPTAESDLLGQLKRARDEAAALAIQIEALSKGETP